MKINKNQLALGGAVLGGVAVAVTAVAGFLTRKRHVDYVEASSNHICNQAEEIGELREALVRSHVTSTKLREDHTIMRDAIVGFAGTEAPVLQAVGDAPIVDPFVEDVVERTFVRQELEDLAMQEAMCEMLGCDLEDCGCASDECDCASDECDCASDECDCASDECDCEDCDCEGPCDCTCACEHTK